MDQLVVRGRVVPHQLHRVPVFLPLLRIEIEPREVAELVRELRVEGTGDLRVVIRDGASRAAGPGVREKRDVHARFELQRGFIDILRDREFPEFHKVVSGA